MFERVFARILRSASELTLGLYRRFSRGRFSSRAGNFAVAVHVLVSKKFQYASPGLIRAFRERRLKELFGITLDELSRRPVLTKAELRERTVRGEPAFPRWRWTAYETTGSTGAPLRVFRDTKYWPLNTATHCRVFLEHGSNLSEGQICIGMQPGFWLAPRNVFWLSTRDLYLNRNEVARFFERNREELRKVRVLEGYPSHFFALAKLLKENNVPAPQVDILAYIAEELTPRDRARLEGIFGGKIYGMYGLTETGIVGIECEKQDGYHLEEWRHIVEIVDEAGAPVPVGTRGRVVVTALWNEVMPLLRYDTGDLGVLRPESCACGRRSPVLELIGRQAHEITLRDGGKAHVFLIEPVFRSEWRAVERYQVVQRKPGEIEVKIIPTEHFSPEAESRIKEALQKILGRQIAVTLSPVSAISLAPHEKHRTFVSLMR